MKILSLLSLAALLACAGHKQDVKPIAEKPQAPASVAPRPQAPPTPLATAAQATQGVTAATAAPALMPDEQFRQKKPDPLPVQPHFDPPVPVEKKLKNGARVLIVENHQIPLVTVEVVLLHGVDADPQGKPGLAEFVADTVDEGTKSRSATRLAEEIEDLAAHLGAGASLQSSSASLNCLTETLPKALDLLADVVQNPAFRNEDVERVRVIKLTQLEQKKASIGALAGDEANRVLFGPNHPWGQPSGGTPESVAAATPDDLATFHAAWWVPNNAVISVAGDVKPAEVVKLLSPSSCSRRFRRWRSGASTRSTSRPRRSRRYGWWAGFSRRATPTRSRCVSRISLWAGSSAAASTSTCARSTATATGSARAFRSCATRGRSSPREASWRRTPSRRWSNTRTS